MALNSLEIRRKYKTVECNIVNDFYIPVLSHSNKYYRAVGYFSSQILVDYVKGLRKFINKNGKIKLLISPVLSLNDLNTLKMTFNPEYQKKEIENLFESFMNEKLSLTASKLLFLLVKTEMLEIRVALPKNEKGLFHEKIGIFHDELNNTIAISGSNNETSAAARLNFESFNTFCSWKEGQNYYVDEHIADFDKYWNGNYEDISVMELHSALDNRIIELFNTDEKIEDLFLTLFDENKTNQFQLQFQPRSYQKEAVDKWFETRKGIFKFATGSGKTKTAIYLMEQIKLIEQKKVFLIVVPDKTLLNQWNDEISQYTQDIVICYSENPNWQVKLKDRIDIFSIENEGFFYIITTNDSFHTEKMRKQLRKIKDKSVLVVDECHTWGTTNTLNNLPKITDKLGLSATPEIHFSLERTEKLLSYFGGIISEYSLEDAIRDKRLVEYVYKPILVKLTEDEKREYEEITKKIVKVIGYDKEDYIDFNDKILESLFYKRSRILYGAKEKLFKLEKIVKPLASHGNLLIYCGTTSSNYETKNEENFEVLVNQISMVNQILSRLDIRSTQYTSQESEEERKIALREFKRGTFSSLVAIKCLDEGVDIPESKTAIIMSSSTNPREFIQRRGRILRQDGKKTHATIYDFIIYEETYDSIFTREANRFIEFSRLAKNKDELYTEFDYLIKLMEEKENDGQQR